MGLSFLTPIGAGGNQEGKEVAYNSIFEYLAGSYLYIKITARVGLYIKITARVGLTCQYLQQRTERPKMLYIMPYLSHSIII